MGGANAKDAARNLIDKIIPTNVQVGLNMKGTRSRSRSFQCLPRLGLVDKDKFWDKKVCSHNCLFQFRSHAYMCNRYITPSY